MLKEYYSGLKPYHLFLYGTVFAILPRVNNEGNFTFEIVCSLLALILYVLALLKQLKQIKK